MIPRRILRLIVAVFACIAGLGVAVTAHAADPVADTYVVTGELAQNGALTVTEVITFADGMPGTLTQRLPKHREATSDGYYTFSYDSIRATADGVDLAPTTTDEADFLVVSVPTAKADGKPITISYVVTGAVVADAQGQAVLSWRMLQGLSVEVRKVEGTLRAPAFMLSLDCTSGPPNSILKCSTFAGGTHESPNPTFTDGPRGPGEVVNLNVVYPEGAIQINQHIAYRWSLDRAFSVNTATLLASLGLFLVGGAALFLLHRRHGVDLGQREPTLIAEFEPVGEGRSTFRVIDDVRPGEIGTVADERVDPIDITGTLLDLAVRGHMRIHELPTGTHENLDWRFERLGAPTDGLKKYELRLLDAIAPADAPACSVSSISETLAPVVSDVQSDLYDDVVDRGWFESRPDSIRGSWARIGWGMFASAVVASLLLVLFTTWALLTLPLFALALGLIWVSERMPRRTASGSSLVTGLSLLSGMLQTYPTDRMPEGREYEELSKVLPYAVVLGGKDRWLQALVDADDDPDEADPTDLDWYHAPGDWHLRHLPGAVKAFVTSVQGELFSR